MVTIVIQAEGPNADEALRLAAGFFETEFGIEAKTEPVAADKLEKGLDPAWLAVLFAVPGAILATMELVQRARLIERTEAMLTQMRAKLGNATATIRIGASRSFNVATVKARELIDAIKAEGGEDAD